MRPGLVFRSASPQFLTDADAARFVRDAGLRLVLDLRFEDESAVEGHGALGDAGVAVRNVPVTGAGGSQIELTVLAGELDQLGAHYKSYVRCNPAAFATAVRALAEPDGTPALIHCAAGKDRTGVLVAVLLSALGVPDEAIVADYARTAHNIGSIMRSLRTAATYADAIGRRPDDDEFALAPAETMQRFLDWLVAEYGSARDMLLGAGLEPAALDVLADRLVERAAA